MFATDFEISTDPDEIIHISWIEIYSTNEFDLNEFMVTY